MTIISKLFLLREASDGIFAPCNMIENIPMDDRDTKGDLYEYMLTKLTTAGQNGQYRTPRHIIKMMVKMTRPKPDDIICDPACGTAGFLIASADYLRDNYPEIRTDQITRERFRGPMFHAVTYGTSRTICMHPSTITHEHMTPEERAAVGIDDGLIRLSIGLENPDDLIAELDQALSRI